MYSRVLDTHEKRNLTKSIAKLGQILIVICSTKQSGRELLQYKKNPGWLRKLKPWQTALVSGHQGGMFSS